MDSWGDTPERARPVHSVRETEQHLNDLKKENFSLKLRIYFLEEKVQQKFEESGEHVHRQNVELKVEVESLKKDLEEKEQLLDEALSTAQSVSEQHNDFRQTQKQLEEEVRSLQKKMSESEGENKELQAALDTLRSQCRSPREVELRSEVSELHAPAVDAPGGGDGEHVALQAALVQAQLELQAAQRAQRGAERAHENLQRSVESLQSDLQAALQHHRNTEEHNQELQAMLELSRRRLQEMDERLRDDRTQRRREREEGERHLRELRTSLQRNKMQLQEVWELVSEGEGERDLVLHKLRQRIRERDAAMERALHHKFLCVEEKEAELRGLQQLLREKDRDSERQGRALANNQETISSLELLLRGKTMQLLQLSDALKDTQQLQRKHDERHENVAKQRQQIIDTLQGALQASQQEVQDLRCVLLPQVHSAPTHILEELKLRLLTKDRLLREVMSDRNLQAQQHQQQVEDLCDVLSSRERAMLESQNRLSVILDEQTSRLQEFRRQLSSSQRDEVTEQSGRCSSECGGNKQEEELQGEGEELQQLSVDVGGEEDGVEQELLQLWNGEAEGQRQKRHEKHKEFRLQLIDPVAQHRKQVQVDLQDLGYETCGRSENEAEREDTSSPEFDDLEMCTSLVPGRGWVGSALPGPPGPPGPPPEGEALCLQRLVEELRSQLGRSQAVIRGLRARGSPAPPAPPSTQPSDDEGWQSSDGAAPGKPRPLRQDRDLQELFCRVAVLEEHLRNKNGTEGDKKVCKSSQFDSLIQTQARELSALRQRVKEGGAVCGVLTQHMCEITKAFEELLRENDVDFFTGQKFREMLQHSSTLISRVRVRVLGRDHSEDPDDKTELLAIRLSKELQQKDQLIQSLQAKLELHPTPPPQRSDTPCSSHAPSDATDLSDRISYVSEEQGSTNEELELSWDETATDDPSVCVSSSLHSAHTQRAAGESAPLSVHAPAPCPPLGPLPHRVEAGPTAFSLSEVTKELQALQRTLHNSSSSSPLCRPVNAVLRPRPSERQGPARPPAHCHSSSLPYSDVGVTIRDSADLLHSSALWDVSCGPRALRLGAELCSGSSGYQSGGSNPGGENVLEEQLREFRSLRQRLEDSIVTNERLRQQLEEKLTRSSAPQGAPTNIYIQREHSLSEQSSELRLLKEERLHLQNQLTDGDLLRAKLKEVELQSEKWAEHSRKLTEEVEHLRQQRIRDQEIIEGLKQELSAHKHTERTRCSADGLHAVGHVDDLTALQQQILEGSSLLQNVQENLRSLNASQQLHQLWEDTHTLSLILRESDSLLRRFWRTSLGGSVQGVTDQLVTLQLKLSEKDRALKDATEILHRSNSTKESMERFIVSQLWRTRCVLSRAKSNLQQVRSCPEDSVGPSSLHVGPPSRRGHLPL